MDVLPNIESIVIPKNPSREWVWYRILISIDYYILKKPTALQWALLNIIFNLDKFKNDLTTDKVAQKLAVEKTIIDEGLINLLDEKLINLKPRKRADILQNYIPNETIEETFSNYELIPLAKENKKFILFYDYKDERVYQYQSVERNDSEHEEEVDIAIFEIVLLAIIEQIWKDLEKNPHSLIGEVEYPKVLEHKFLKDLQSIKLESIHLNFL